MYCHRRPIQPRRPGAAHRGILPHARGRCNHLLHGTLHISMHNGFALVLRTCTCSVRLHLHPALRRPRRAPRVTFRSPPQGEAMHVNNGIPADQLPMARWHKSRVSNPTGSCVEVAELPGGAIAVRNSRHPSGPALIYTRAEVAAFLAGVKPGAVYHLCPRGRVALSPEKAVISLRRFTGMA